MEEKAKPLDRIAFFDTNILSFLAKKERSIPRVKEYLNDNNLILGISSQHVAELQPTYPLHGKFGEIVSTLPARFLKTYDMVFNEEIVSHPDERKSTLILSADAIKASEFSDYLNSSALKDAREEQSRYAKMISGRVEELRSNFPISEDGDYSVLQANDFADMFVLQHFLPNEYDTSQFLFLKSYENRVNELNLNIFKSIRLRGYVIFYKYYINKIKKVKHTSDFGDLAHIYCLPYCSLIVTERALCKTLNHIKRTQNILQETTIADIDFIRSM
jgi:hypothetical protein